MQRVILAGIFILLIFITSDFQAQCVMCRAVAEDASTQGGMVGAGINKAIIYLMGIPYVLLAVLAFVFFMRRQKANERQIPT